MVPGGFHVFYVQRAGLNSQAALCHGPFNTIR